MAGVGAEEKLFSRLKNLLPNLVLRVFSVQTTVKKKSHTRSSAERFCYPTNFSPDPTSAITIMTGSLVHKRRIRTRDTNVKQREWNQELLCL